MLDAVIFATVTGNADAHGKNHSFLYTKDTRRLAPLYDQVLFDGSPKKIRTAVVVSKPISAKISSACSFRLRDLRLVGFRFSVYFDSMKTTIDIPDAALADAMRFTGAKTKREAVVKAMEGYNRQQRVRDLVASFGTLDFASNDEIEAGDLEELKEAGGRKS